MLRLPVGSRGSGLLSNRRVKVVRLLAVLALVCASTLLGVASSAETAGDRSSSPPRLTRDVPRFVTQWCVKGRSRSPIRVVCPPLVPVTAYRKFPGVSGVLTLNEPPAKIYLLGFNAGDTGPTYWHWIAGMGTPAGINRWVLSDAQNVVRGKPKLLRVMTLHSREVKIWRFPPYPGGGQFGGHVAAITRSGPYVAIASVHGYDTADASARVAVELAQKADAVR